MQFNFTIHRAGWPTVGIDCGGAPLLLTASYLQNSFRDLASAMLALFHGARETIVVIMAEPGEHHLILRRSESSDIDMEVVWYSVWKSMGFESNVVRTLLVSRTSLEHLGSQVLLALGRALAENGLEGYKEAWGYEFPQTEYEGNNILDRQGPIM
jgi:hypothetical protein